MATQDRYANQLDLRTLDNGKIVYRSARPKAIQSSPLTDVSITANDALRADVIASNVYGDATQWWRIASVNRPFAGSLFFRPGMNIIIPSKS